MGSLIKQKKRLGKLKLEELAIEAESRNGLRLKRVEAEVGIKKAKRAKKVSEQLLKAMMRNKCYGIK